MKSDPMERANVTAAARMPPSQGLGSGKAAWVAYAIAQAENGCRLWDMIDGQTAAIKDLEAEIDLLRKQIATRKPKGGRPRVPDDKVQRIEVDLAAGHSKRSVAAHHRVSAMTVVRIAQRIAARAAQA